MPKNTIKREKHSVKHSETITYQPKSFENPNIVDIKSIIIEHPKTLHNLSKIGIVGSSSSFYSDTKIGKFF